MDIEKEKYNDVVICTLKGEIDINSSPELRKTFNDILSENQKKVLVDFSGISFIDSSGLATLIEILQRLKKIGGGLRFCNIADNIKNILEITKIIKLFEIFDNRQEALKDF